MTPSLSDSDTGRRRFAGSINVIPSTCNAPLESGRRRLVLFSRSLACLVRLSLAALVLVRSISMKLSPEGENTELKTLFFMNPLTLFERETMSPSIPLSTPSVTPTARSSQRVLRDLSITSSPITATRRGTHISAGRAPSRALIASWFTRHVVADSRLRVGHRILKNLRSFSVRPKPSPLFGRTPHRLTSSLALLGCTCSHECMARYTALSFSAYAFLLG
mmetsp:Transcript_8655/g.14031  ORF Transcript_8655/g.14031 Transcript_8655/m.14031 type:complete len:220 (-) Transcript_8655:1741-2400(-)